MIPLGRENFYEELLYSHNHIIPNYWSGCFEEFSSVSDDLFDDILNITSFNFFRCNFLYQAHFIFFTISELKQTFQTFNTRCFIIWWLTSEELSKEPLCFLFYCFICSMRVFSYLHFTLVLNS